MQEPEFYIVPSLSEQSTYFVFRDIGMEIKFKIENNKIILLSNGLLVPDEIEFISSHFFRNLVQ